MSDAFVAEIRLLPFAFAPKGWAFCNGQLVPVSQNTALFSLISTFYGGDGKSTFGLPNLQGAVALHPGQGPGLSQYVLGQTGGTDAVTLVPSEMPAHLHQAKCSSTLGDDYGPKGDFWAPDVTGNPQYGASATLTMAADVLGPGGASQPHNNMQPFLVLRYCIAMEGIFPAKG
jgi:microcystin-dependent protein